MFARIHRPTLLLAGLTCAFAGCAGAKSASPGSDTASFGTPAALQ